VALHQLEQEYSREQLVHVEYHTSQIFNFPEATTRYLYYGNTGTPAVYWDGYDLVLGGGTDMYPFYKPVLDQHLLDLAKMTVDAYIHFDEVTDTGSITVTCEVAPGETINNVNECKIRVVIYEDDIHSCCYPPGVDTWNSIARDVLPDTPLTIAAGGEIQTFTHNFTILDEWDADQLKAVVWVQRDSNKRELQAALASLAYDIELVNFDPIVQKVATSATAVWDTEVTYTGVLSGDVSVELDETSLAPGWDAEIVWNSTVYGSSLTIPGMTPSQLEAVQVRVVPPVGTPGLGTVRATVMPVDDPLRAVTSTYHSFSGTEALLFIDDDTSTGFDAEFLAAIAGSGHFAVVSDFAVDGVLLEPYLSLYDAVIWNTGELQTGTIGLNAQGELSAYLDGGGAFFLSSQGFLNHMGNVGEAFREGYLKVADGWSQDAGCATATGVAGDPIGDGLAFTMSYPFVDRADRITALPGGVIWLNAPANGAGVRYDSGTFRTVFMSAAFEGVPEGAAANDQATLMGSILDWLVPGGAVGVEPLAPASTELALGQNAPNPFGQDTRVHFAIPTAGPVKLTVFDVAGRRVATLVDRALVAGAHTVAWDGRDAGGVSVASGVYLYRLEAGGRSITKEMVRLQ
jgi:hypothetical protein